MSIYTIYIYVCICASLIALCKSLRVSSMTHDDDQWRLTVSATSPLSLSLYICVSTSPATPTNAQVPHSGCIERIYFARFSFAALHIFAFPFNWRFFCMFCSDFSSIAFSYLFLFYMYLLQICGSAVNWVYYLCYNLSKRQSWSCEMWLSTNFFDKEANKFVVCEQKEKSTYMILETMRTKGFIFYVEPLLTVADQVF